MAASKEMEIAIRIAGKVESSLKNALGTATKGIGKVAKVAAKASLAAGAGVAGLAVAGINVGKEFEAAMSQVSATMLLDKSTEKGQQAFETLKNAARECGATTAFSATEAAEALNYLALAGYDADKAASALPTVLNLAGAGAMDLAAASDMVTDSMSALKIDATEKNLKRFSDQLAKTASKSNTSVSQLGEAIIKVGGTASGLAGGTTELNTALGILADNGIKAAEGGTHLRNMIMSLQKARNSDAAAMFDDLGLEAYDKATGDMRSLGDIFGDLNKSLDGASAEKIDKTLSTIFKQTDLTSARAMLAATADSVKTLGSVMDASLAESGTSMAKLGININDMAKNFDTAMSQQQFTKQMRKEFSMTKEQAGILFNGLQSLVSGTGNRFGELSAAIKDSKGACEDMYNIQNDNLAGDLKALSSAASNLGLSFYDDVGGPIRDVTKAATGMVTQLNNAYMAGGLSSMMAEVGNCMGQVVDGIAQYAPIAVNTGIELVQNLVNGITQNSDGIASAAGNILTTFANGIFSLAPQNALTGIDIILQLANSLISQAPQLITSGVEAITGFIDGLMQRGPDIANTAIGLIQTLTVSIMTNAPKLLMSGIQLMDNLAQGIQANLPKLIPAAMQALVSFSGSLRTNAGKLVDAGLNLVMTLAQSLISNIPVFIQTIPTIVTNIAGIINDNAPKLLSAGLQLAVQLLAGIIQAVPTIIANIPQIIQAVVSVFTAFNWMALGGKIITFIGNGIRTVITSIPQIFSNFAQTVRSTLTSFNWHSLGSGIVRTIANGIKGMITSVPQLFKNMGHFAIQGIKSINWLNVGKTIIQLIGTAISGAGGFIVDAIKGIGGGIIDGIKGIFGGGDDAESSGAEASKSYAAGIESNIDAVSSAASSLPNAAFGGMDLSSASTAGTASANAFNTSFDAGVSSNLIELNTASATAAMSTAGTESANAFNNSFDSSINSNAFDISNIGINTDSLSTAGQTGALAIGNGFANNAQAVTTAATGMADGVNAALDSGWQKAVSSANSSMNSLVNTVSAKAQAAANAIKSAFEGMVITIPKPKIPVISTTYKTESYGDGGNVKLPQFSVNWNAQGGIFDKPTIFNTHSGMQGVGEAGAEAILPLDALWARMSDIVSREIRANNDGSVVDALLGKLKDIGAAQSRRSTLQPAAAGCQTIQYSPTYNIYGNAGKNDILDAAHMSQKEFDKMMKRWQKDNRRTKF